MSRSRFQDHRPYSSAELFIIGGRDQKQVEPEPGGSRTPDGLPIHRPYGIAEAAIDSMVERGHDFTKLTPTLTTRDGEIANIANQVSNAQEIEAARQKIAHEFNKIS
jgi:hypothetical protein